MATLDSIRQTPGIGSTERSRLSALRDPVALVAFGLPAAALLLYALRGASYDLVVRQEFGLGVWWILALGLTTGALPRARLHPSVALPAVGFVIVVAATALGLIYTESDERTVNELARVIHYGGVLALALCVVDRRTFRHAAAGLACGAVMVSLLALTSRLWPGLFPEDVVDRVFPSSRLQYPLNYWNAVAAFTAMSAVLALGLSAHAQSRLGRALALAPVPTVIATTYLTYARGGIVAVAVGLIALVILVPHRALVLVHALVAAAASTAVIATIRGYEDIARGEGTEGAVVVLLVVLGAGIACAAVAAFTHAAGADRRLRLPSRPARLLAAGTAVVMVTLAVSVGPGLVDAVIDKLKGPPPATTPTGDPAARLSTLSSARYGVWSAALDTHAAEAWHGVGPGTFEFAWNRSPHYSHFVRDAHSFYLESLAEGGWIGLGAGLLFLGGLLCAGTALRVRARADPVEAGWIAALLATFVVFLAYAGYDWMWESTAVSVFGLLAVAIALASAGRPRDRLVGLPVRGVLAAVALVAVLTQLPGLVSTAKIRSSQEAVREGAFPSALSDAEDAVASAPWAASPYVHRGLLFERAGRLADARADILRAWEREPTNYRHPLLLARIEALRGQVGPAIAAFRDARELAPRKRLVAGGPAPFAPPSDEP